MHNEEPRVAAAAPDADDPAGLHLLYDQEMLQLNATIAELLGSVHALAQEKNRAQGLSDIILQLREANEHLVLATFGARDLQARAEATTLRQYEFLSMLAHELRNPLQPMAMANNLLKELVGLHPNLARVYGVNQRQISHMARLIDDLFDASRISQGRITLQSAPLLLHDIISVAVETSQPAMTLRNQQLHLYLPAAPLSIHGDMVRLCQLFSNLLLNASKFTHEYGHITIRARQVQDRVEVSVSDDGAGIAAELKPVVFDLFTQGFRSLDRAQGGLGIGLAMVRTIAELHHGSVTVDSDGPGQGSCFTVAIPLACPVGHAGAVPALPASARPCAVLVIEDHVDANDILALLLRDAGHTVTQCFDGASGLRAGLNGKFDVVICDIGLPGLDGFQVVSALCADNAAARPCFIATSGYSDAIKRKHATEAGFDHYLIKPISMPALAHIMAQHCLRDVKAGS